jgi:hypothetical protein
MTDEDDMTLEEFAEEYPNLYRECSEKFLRVFHVAIQRMPDCIEKWGIAFATGNPICFGQSMSDVARKLDGVQKEHSGKYITRAAISYEARKFCDDMGLPPSPYMKSEESIKVAQNARNLALKIRQTNKERNQ